MVLAACLVYLAKALPHPQEEGEEEMVGEEEEGTVGEEGEELAGEEGEEGEEQEDNEIGGESSSMFGVCIYIS